MDEIPVTIKFNICHLQNTHASIYACRHIWKFKYSVNYSFIHLIFVLVACMYNMNANVDKEICKLWWFFFMFMEGNFLQPDVTLYTLLLKSFMKECSPSWSTVGMHACMYSNLRSRQYSKCIMRKCFECFTNWPW